MSAPANPMIEAVEETTPNSDKHDEYWLVDEFFDNMVDIINENFVLEVEASLKLRG